MWHLTVNGLCVTITQEIKRSEREKYEYTDFRNFKML